MLVLKANVETGFAWPMLLQQAGSSDKEDCVQCHRTATCGHVKDIARSDLHMQACSPHFIFLYFLRLGYVGWTSLGGIVLAITDKYPAHHVWESHSTSWSRLIMSAWDIDMPVGSDRFLEHNQAQLLTAN